MYVYILRSASDPRRHYVGLTNNHKERLKEHNAGDSEYTRKFRPWRIKAMFWFADNGMAEDFERYLKTGSGRAFAKRHFHSTDIQLQQ